MKKIPHLIILVLILIMLLSGCLPKVPKEITGPTWTSKYRIPLIKMVDKDKIYFNHEPAGETGENLGLEDMYTDLSYNLESDEPMTFELMDEPPTVELGPISGTTIEVTDGGGVNVEVEVSEENAKRVDLTFVDFNDYINLTLSDNQDSVNYINIQLNGATAVGEEGFTIILLQETEELKRTRIWPGTSSGRLNLSGLEFAKDIELEIIAYGRLETTEDITEIGVTFDPGPLEIGSFTIGQASFEDREDFNPEPVEETIDLPEEIKKFELALKTASLKFTTNLPENMKITADLTVEGIDEDGKALPDCSFTEQLVLTRGENNCPLVKQAGNDLNTILQSKPDQLSLKIEPRVALTGDLTMSYPENNNVNLDYVMRLGVESFTYRPEENDGIQTGEIETPEDLPVDFVSGKLFLDIKNTSATGLEVELWLSPDLPPYSDPADYTLTIVPNDSQECCLNFTKKLYNELRENDTFYYQLIITNLSQDSDEPAEFGTNDYLEITAWADVEVNINP